MIVLTREHSILGRFECIGERGLAVEHSVFVEGFSGAMIMRVVLAVHSAAMDAHRTLGGVGVIEDNEDEPEPRG